MIYFFWPETARLSLEEIAAQFGEEVAVDIHAMSPEERAALDKRLKSTDVAHMDERVVSELGSLEKTVPEHNEEKASQDV